MTEFDRGVLYAAGILAVLHNQPSMAADIIREAGLDGADCSSMDEYDKENLKLVDGKGVCLKGL